MSQPVAARLYYDGKHEKKTTMVGPDLSSETVAVVAPDYFEAVELTEPTLPNLVELGYGSESSQR